MAAARRGHYGTLLALAVGLLALSSSVRAQGLLDMFQNGAAPSGTGTATPTPTNGSPAPIAGTTTGTPSPTTGASPAPATGTTPTPTNTDPAAAGNPLAAGTTSPAPGTTAPAAGTTSPAPGTTAPAAGTTSPAPGTTAPAAGTTTPAGATTTPPSNIPAGTAVPPGTLGTGTNTQPVPLNANDSAKTPAVAAAPGSDTAAVVDVGTVGTQQQLEAENTLPPGPPLDWQTMQKDCQLVFDVEIRGAYIVPFTSPKASVIARVLRDRYLRSAQLPDFSVQAVNTFTYLSYDTPTADATALASATDAAAAAAGALGRRLAAHRGLLQIEKSGAELKIVLTTASMRVDSEIATFEEGVDSGMMARDITLAGIDVENLTLLAPPYQRELIGPGNTSNSSNGGTQSWVVGVIVGAILLALPLPTFLLVRWTRRRNREARDVAAAEAEAARARMQSKMMRHTGSKSFSLKGGSSADIMVRSGSVGGLAGYAHNGRLQSWSSGHERQYGQVQQYTPYGVSRQTSMTSAGSALQSARGTSFQGRTPSLPGSARPPLGGVSPAYEEELQAARSARSTASGR